jgi:membrane-associated phospholipid phosphatase
VRRVLIGYAGTAVALARLRRRLNLPRPLGLALAASVPPAVAAATPPGRRRRGATWAAHMWAYKVAFEVPYDKPDALRARLRVEAAPRIDRILGAGMEPSRRLQHRLRRPDGVNTLDRLLSAVYFAWELEPHAVLAWILVRHPERFARAALRLGAAFDLTLLGYWLVPAAPPWWASEEAGLLGREVRRVPTRVIRDLRGEPLDQDDVQGHNPWAAMPSDHFGSALMAALLLVEIDVRLGAVALSYALTLGFALVYLGEHYVVDLLAGACLVAVVIGAEAAARDC